MKLTYAVVIEQTPNNYGAYAPDVPGCVSTGKTWDEMQAMIREALVFHIEALLDDGEPLPEPTMAIDEPIAHHIEPVPEHVLNSYTEFGKPAPTNSTRFELVEIEVPTPQLAAEARRALEELEQLVAGDRERRLGAERGLGRVRAAAAETARLRSTAGDSVLEAQVLIEDWRIENNTTRPHSSLGWLAPAAYAEQRRAEQLPPASYPWDQFDRRDEVWGLERALAGRAAVATARAHPRPQMELATGRPPAVIWRPCQKGRSVWPRPAWRPFRNEPRDSQA